MPSDALPHLVDGVPFDAYWETDLSEAERNFWRLVYFVAANDPTFELRSSPPPPVLTEALGGTLITMDTAGWMHIRRDPSLDSE